MWLRHSVDRRLWSWVSEKAAGESGLRKDTLIGSPVASQPVALFRASDVRLTESLYVPLSPDWKAELKGYARPSASRALGNRDIWLLRRVGDAPGLPVFILAARLRPLKR